MSLQDALELALHRALRGEIAPDVYAISADLSTRPIRLHVYGGAEAHLFEEVIESEMQQCLPHVVDQSLAQIACTFHLRAGVRHLVGTVPAPLERQRNTRIADTSTTKATPSTWGGFCVTSRPQRETSTVIVVLLCARSVRI